METPHIDPETLEVARALATLSKYKAKQVSDDDGFAKIIAVFDAISEAGARVQHCPVCRTQIHLYAILEKK